jgi:hypothetical protein
VNTPAQPSRRKLKALLAFSGFVVLASLGAFLYLDNPKPLEAPPGSVAKVIEALERYYIEEQALTGFQQGSDPLDQTKQPPSPQTAPAFKPNTITSLQIVRVTERKSRRKMVLTVRPTFNGGPPPDGIPERNIILLQSDSGQWQVQPILPSGAPPLSE